VHADCFYFFNIHGNVHYEFIPKCETVNQYSCSDVLHLQEDVQQKQLGNVILEMVSPPWQCSCSLCFICVRISGQ